MTTSRSWRTFRGLPFKYRTDAHGNVIGETVLDKKEKASSAKLTKKERNGVLAIVFVTFSMIDRLFGGKGVTAGNKNRDLTDIEQSVMEGIIVRILANMREAWTQVIDLRPRLGQIGDRRGISGG